MCDGCDFWHHAKCVDMPATEYVRLSDSPEYWHCRPCTLPPFSDSFFNSTTSTLGLDLMTESFDMSDGANIANDSAPDTELTSNTSDGDDDVRLFPELRQLQDQFRKNFKLGHLNINSIGNKFGPISELLGENLLQYLAITESKIDDTFPDSQFSVPNYTMYRRDRNQHGGGVLSYIRSDVPNRRLTDIDTNDLEIIINEISLQKVKWIVIAVYRPPNCDANVFLDKMQSIVDDCLIRSSNIVITGDLNLNLLDQDTESSPGMKLNNFMDIFDFKNVVREPTCYATNNPTLIDVIITNCSQKFAKTLTCNTSLSDNHDMVVSVLKKHAPCIKKNPERLHIEHTKP